MDNLTTSISAYALDPENADLNYNVAAEYYAIGQTASALSFYLRAAERTLDKDLAYECMIRVAQCFDRQGNRHNSVRGAYKHAILIQPKRPEAYYLLGNFNYYVNWPMEAYVTVEQGLNFSNFENNSPLRSDVGYPGKYGLIYVKAASAWGWGKSQESRDLFHELADNYYDELTPSFVESVKKNLVELGCTPERDAFCLYSKDKYDRLKFKFPGSELIERNYSQAYHDMFILTALNGKRNGTYLEIGSADPFFGNNSALLEKLFAWTGVGIEMNPKFIDIYRANRSNEILCENALETNYEKILKKYAVNGAMDYLQVDCEPSRTTFEVLLSLPLHKYKFGVISYEHDYYVDITRSYRPKSRAYLKAMGYVLVVGDVSVDGKSTFEDWWVHPDVVDQETIDKLSHVTGTPVKIEDYFISKELTV